jgi:hypothetical protein
MKTGIGIGCFWFEPKGDLSEEFFENFNGKDFLSKIKNTLESVDSISSVQIYGEGNSILADAGEDEDDEKLYFPIFCDVIIEFNLYLPFRVQNQYGRGFERAKNTENFRVVIHYGLAMPVVYIFQKEIDETVSDTSSPVMFIREYLKEKLQNDKNCQFQCLGPSPFHSEIFLDISNSNESKIIDSKMNTHSRGYNDILIQMTVDSETDPLGLFISKYHEILESYYSLVMRYNRSLHNDSYVFNATQELLEKEKTDNFFVKIFRDKKLINSVYEKILDDKLNRIALEREVLRKTRDLVFVEDNVFYFFIKKEIEEISQIPVDEVREILTISESRRSQLMQNTSTLISGLVGGVVGAVLGSYLTFVLAQPIHKPIIHSVDESKKIESTEIVK